MTTIDERCTSLEASMQVLTQRVHALESRVFAGGTTAPAPSRPPSTAWSQAAPVRDQRTDVSPSRRPFGDVSVTPSRVLAAAGGLVLLLGLGYLLRYAVAQGWLGPAVRVSAGLVGAGVLALVGYRLEQAASTQVIGRICTATAAAGGYTAIVAAVVLYGLIPSGLGLLAAAAVAGAALLRGATTSTLGVAALGIGGALAAPMLIADIPGPVTLGFTVVALAAGLAVAVVRRWPQLTAIGFVLVTPQLWSLAQRSSGLPALVFAAVCGALILAACVAHAGGREWRSVSGTAAIAVLNALSVAALGVFTFVGFFSIAEMEAGRWLLAVALGHAGVAVAVSRRRFGPPIAVVLGIVAVAIGTAATVLLADGYAVTAALAAVALAATAATRVPWLRDVARPAAGLQIVLVALSALQSSLGMAAVGSGSAVLVVTLLCAAGILFIVAAEPAEVRLARGGGAVFGGLAVVRLLTHEARLSSLLEGAADLSAALVMCAIIAAAAIAAGQLTHHGFTAAGVAALNYGLSLAAVAIDPDGVGRVALTGLWSATGGVALVLGRRTGRVDVRKGGAALLVAAVSKAAFVDTATLGGTSRAVALLLCGSVLVTTAVVEARALPSPRGDRAQPSP